MLFLIGILAVPVLCRYLARLLPVGKRRDLPIANAVLIAALAGAIALGFPDRAAIQEQTLQEDPLLLLEKYNII